jgi:hypothetical protein
MRTNFALIGVLLVAAASPQVRADTSAASDDEECNVTVPNGIVAGAVKQKRWSHGNSLLSVGPFGLWPDGTVEFRPGGAGFTTPDGGLGMKFGWTRGVPGRLKVSGRRLDAFAPPLILEAKDGYGDLGFQPSYVIFSAPGCWEVSAQVGERLDSRVVFVTKVVRIGEGPAVRPAPTDR